MKIRILKTFILNKRPTKKILLKLLSDKMTLYKK